jgi:hypothetical protein
MNLQNINFNILADTSQMITDQLRQMNASSRPSNNDLLKVGSQSDCTDGQMSNFAGFRSPTLMDSLISSSSHVEDEDDDVILNDDEDPDFEDEKKDGQLISMLRVSKVVGCDCSDLRLILNVAAVYNPPVLLSVL